MSDSQVGFLLAPLTFVHVIASWAEFLGRMLVVALALLPLASIALAVSQKTRSPIITLFITIYLMKIMLSSWECVSPSRNCLGSRPAPRAAPR